MSDEVPQSGSVARPYQPAPNWCSVLVDIAKAMIALTSGLLGVSVTFGATVLANDATATQRGALIVSWLFLLGALMSGVLCAFWTVNYLRVAERERLAIGAANLCFFCLVAAAVAFLVLGIAEVSSGSG